MADPIEPREAPLASQTSDAKQQDALPEVSAATGAVRSTNETPVLTPQEQMARFEEQLKEDDWGHQPC